METTPNRIREMARYTAVAAALYLLASLAALSLPELLGVEGNTLTVIGGAVMLFLIGILPAALVARVGVGVALAALATGAMVLVAQLVLVVLGLMGVPGLLNLDRHPVSQALIQALVFALYALVPAAAAAILTSAGLRIWRNRHRLRSSQG